MENIFLIAQTWIDSSKNYPPYAKNEIVLNMLR